MTTAAVAACAALLASAGMLVFRNAAPARPHPAVFTFSSPADETFAENTAPIPSPDGRRIAFVTRNASGQRVVWSRPIESTAAQRLAGTEGVVGNPFWSPDGRFIGFVADGRLKKIDLAGGPALSICQSQGNLGAAWGGDNVIVFAPINRSPLFRVPAAGGTPEPMTALNAERRENSHRFPSFLPDGRHFLFTARSDVRENNLIYVGSLDSPDIKPLFAAQSNVVYALPGYLLFAQEGTLMAQPFDARARSIAGEAFPIAPQVEHNTPSSQAAFGASADGVVLSYRPEARPARQLVWFDRTGKRVEAIGPVSHVNADLRMAPNGKLATMVMPDPVSGNRDIWSIDLAGGNLTRVTSHPANDWQVAWAPDSRQIAFASDRNGKSSVYRTSIDGGDEELLLQLPDRGAFPRDWSADGRFITLNLDTPTGSPHMWALPLFGDRKPFPLGQSAREIEAVVSPDGQWVAYESNESGDTEIYVKPFARAGRLRISTRGGFTPRWRRDGRELFYQMANGDIMSVALKSGAMLEAAAPVQLLDVCMDARFAFDVAGDGSRFLAQCPKPEATPASITVSVDWAAAIKRDVNTR